MGFLNRPATTALFLAEVWVCAASPQDVTPALDKSFAKDQFERKLSDVVSSAESSERDYRQVEKALKKLFPEKARRSPFFISVESEFWSYRQSVKRLDQAVLNLGDARKRYAGLFSVGLFRSLDEIGPEDDNWEAARDLAASMDQNLETARKHLDSMEVAFKVFTSFEERINGVVETQGDLEDDVQSLEKTVGRRRGDWETWIRRFADVDTSISHLTLYTRADSVRGLLETTIGLVDARLDSLKSLEKTLDYLVSGAAVAGDEDRVWDLYESVQGRWPHLSREVEQGRDRGDDRAEELQNSLDLLEIVRKMVSDMDKTLAELTKYQHEVIQASDTDSLRMSSLMGRSRDAMLLTRPPYTELTRAYRDLRKVRDRLAYLAESSLDARRRILEGAADMISPGDIELNELREAKKGFDDTMDEALDQAERFRSNHEAFSAVIVENFVNTPEYWEIQYEVEDKTTDDGRTVRQENFGYLFDPHAYPSKPYHGQLVSEVQFRLTKQKKRPSGGSDYAFVLEGSGPVGVKGVILAQGDTVLFRASRDEAKAVKEIRTGEGVQYEWRISVEPSTLKSLARTSGLILRVHQLTLTHRVNLTLFKKNLYRDYGIPEERLRRWEDITEDEAGVKQIGQAINF